MLMCTNCGKELHTNAVCGCVAHPISFINPKTPTLPKERYLNIWTNRRALEDGSIEKYEANIATGDLEKAQETFKLLYKERVRPIWLIDLHTGNIIEKEE